MNILDFITGFICGGAFALWVHYFRSKPEDKVKSPESVAVKNFLERKPPKPDLKKARYYQSDEHKRQKKFIERMQKGELE